MSSLFFFTGVGKDAAEHVATTIARPVDARRLAGAGAADVIEELRRATL